MIGKQKDKSKMLDEVEAFMAEAWHISEHLQSEGKATRQVLVPIVGRMHCRAILFATNKG